MRYLTILVIVGVACLFAARVDAAEIRGTVTQVDGPAVTLRIGADAKPAKGERVEILAESAGVPDVVVAQGEVTGVVGRLVLARIDEYPKRVKANMKARIVTSGQPAPVKPAPGDAAPSRPTPPPAPKPPRQPPVTLAPGVPGPITIPLPENRSPLKEPAAQDRQITLAVAKLIGDSPNDEIARRTQELFLHTLDPMKMYFEQADVNDFRRRRLSLAGELDAGDISRAYEIFGVYLERIDERMQLVEKWLNAEHDFTADERMLKDRNLVAYPKDGQQAEECWRQWIKYELLTLKKDGVDFDKARQRLEDKYRTFRQRMHQTDREELLEMFLSSFAAAYHPHSSYMSATTSQNSRISPENPDASQVRGAVLGEEHLAGGRTASVGYIDAPDFHMDLRPILEELRSQDADVVVLDLRRNSGGSLKDVLKAAGLFIGDKPVFQVESRDGVKHYASRIATAAWDGPLVLLTSKHTSSGGEILAGAIMDHQRGIVIGDSTTSGKGTIESLFDVGPDFGQVKVTTQKLYRPAGDGIQSRGVRPHLVLPSFPDTAQTAAAAPLYSLAFDRVQPVEFEVSDSAIDAKVLETIRTRSEARREQSPYFQRLAKGLARLAAPEQQSYVTLKEQEYLALSSNSWKGEPAQPLPGIPTVDLSDHLRESLAVALDYTSRMQLKKARKLYSQKRYSDAVRQYKKAVAADPGNSPAHYYLAWLLATCRQSDVRDGTLAVEHARQACEQDSWSQWMYILCLAVAEAEAGSFDDAQKDLEKALEKAPDDQRRAYGYLKDRFARRQKYR